MLPLARYSKHELDPVWVVLWCIIVAFVLLCVSSAHLHGGCTGGLNYLLNKYIISLLRLIFVSHLVSTYVRTL